VSSFVIFNLLIKPFLYKLMGHNYRHLDVQMPLDEPLKRKSTERQSWIPVVITDADTARPVEYHGSAHINALCSADGLVSMDVGVGRIEKGALVPVRLI
jgi:molybdopterin molybdotransferase